MELFEKWQTLIVSVAAGLGVLVMAFLYLRFVSRPEFNKHKAQTTEQISTAKTQLTEQLSEYKAEIQDQLAEVKRSVKDEVTELEKRLDKVPTIEDLHELELKIERLNTNIESVKPGLGHVQKLTDLLMENELREKRHAD